MINKLFTIAIILSLATACNNKKTAGKLHQKSDGLISENSALTEYFETLNSKTIEGVTYKIFHLSEESLRELYKEETNEYGNFSCFYFDIRIDGQQDIANYPSVNYANINEKIHYLSFLMKDFISIKAGDNSYSCINSVFDRTYGKTSSTRFFLVFDKIKEEDITFLFNDNYFNNGEIYLKLKI